MRSFGRKYRLNIGDVEISQLDIEFDVKKTLKKEPNRAGFQIFNLAEKTRRAFQGRDLPVTFHAGYESEYPLGADTNAVLADIGLSASESIPLLFSGTMRYAHSAQSEDKDWVTSTSNGDGDRGLSKARTKRTYRAGTPWLTIIKDLCSDLGVGEGNVIEIGSSIEIATKKLGKGTVLTGSASDELSKILDSSGYDWSIQDGELQVLSYGSTTTTMAVDLNAETGLIGSPEIGLRADKSKSGKKPQPGLEQLKHFVRARSLLNGTLAPGRLVKITAAMITGFYRVESVTHFGSTSDTHWYSDIEATET